MSQLTCLFQSYFPVVCCTLYWFVAKESLHSSWITDCSFGKQWVSESVTSGSNQWSLVEQRRHSALKLQHYTATVWLIRFLGEPRHSKSKDFKIVGACVWVWLLLLSEAAVDVNFNSCLDCAPVPLSWHRIVIHKDHSLFAMNLLNPRAWFWLHNIQFYSSMCAFIVALPTAPLSCKWLTEVAGWASVGTLPKERLCLADKLLNWPSLGHLPDPLSLSLCSPAPYKQLSLPGHTTCLLSQRSTPAVCTGSSRPQTPDGCSVSNMDLKLSHFWFSGWCSSWWTKDVYYVFVLLW